MQHRKKTSGRELPPRQDVLAVFQFVWKELRVRQTEIARETKLDQGTVSKILRGAFSDLDGRAYILWKYAKGRAEKAGFKAGQAVTTTVDPRLAEKISRVWDRTDEGAEALLKLLDAADLIQRHGGGTAAKRRTR